jgi:hypothetical protein
MVEKINAAVPGGGQTELIGQRFRFAGAAGGIEFDSAAVHVRQVASDLIDLLGLHQPKAEDQCADQERD